LGSAAFLARRKARLDGLIDPHIAASYDGPAVAELETVGLSSPDLTKLRKSDARKQALAWLLRR
jgi:hypothetical protein